MNMKKATLLTFFAFLISAMMYSQERRVITTAVPFLMISSDARASGVGEQGVATSVDNFSQHWNPSKYVFSENSSGIAFSYTPYLSKLVNDIFLANVSYYNKLNERSSWSMSLKYFSLGDIDILQNPLSLIFSIKQLTSFSPQVFTEINELCSYNHSFTLLFFL